MQKPFNEYILKSVKMIWRERAHEGYYINGYFTHDLQYGRAEHVKASQYAPRTMCVAAVCEVIIEALNIYAQDTGDYSPFEKLPVRSWNERSVKDIRSWIFQLDDQGFKSYGAPHALQTFGLGRELPFNELIPGDFVTLNRNRPSGHSTVFTGFLNKEYGDGAEYSDRVVGFRYFSSQGRIAPELNSGFAYRWGFFAPHNPVAIEGKPKDHDIIRSSNRNLLNTGRMFHPDDWQVQSSLERLRADYIATRASQILGHPVTDESARRLAGGIDEEMSKALDPTIPAKYDFSDEDDSTK